MSEKIRELYHELYNQNVELLEEKRINAKEEKKGNIFSIIKSIFLRHFLRNAIGIIVGVILIVLMLKFVISDMTPDYRPGEASVAFAFNILIPAFIGLCTISLIYDLVIRPRRTFERNHWIKNSTTEKEEFNDIFCERICKPIIENVIPNSQYEHGYGISKELYESMGFLNSNEQYVSTDNINLNNYTNLTMSKVHTKFKTGGDGYWYDTLFCGIASIQLLTFNMPLYIKIRNRNLESLELENAVEVYDNEFNQYYEIETDNPELLKKYLNNRMLTYFTELAKNNINLEVNIFQNKICIRLHNREFLEFNTNNEINEERIIDSCNHIIAIIDTNKFIVNELKANNIY